MDGLSATASVIAVLQILKEVSSLCYEYLQGAKNAQSDIEQLYGELKRLVSHLEETGKLLEEKDPHGKLRATQTFKGEVKNCTNELKLVQARLVKKKAKASSGLGALLGVSLKWPFKKKEVDTIVERLAKFRGTISASLAVDTAGLTLQGFMRFDEREQVQILTWISSIRYGDHHDLISRRRTQNTCEWLLQHERFKEWENATSSTLIWVHGSPGAGKTYLASKTIDHILGRLEQSAAEEGLAFFYCNRNEEERRKPLSVLQSYVRQLASPQAYPQDMRQKLRELWLEKGRQGSTLNEDDCMKQLRECVNLYPKTTLILDALDECEPLLQRDMIKMLNELKSGSVKPVNIFISSRPDRFVRDEFLSGSNIEISATDNQTDIERFVNDEIAKHPDWKHFSSSLKSTVSHTLLERSQGMFQWAYLQINQLLQLETEDAIRDRLGKLPPDLNAAYDEILKRIGGQHDHYRTLAERAFKWVMCSYHPLSHDELLSAIRIDGYAFPFHESPEIRPNQLLHFCQHLLRYDTRVEVWRVSHLSVVEYFENCHWALGSAHCHASVVCLRLLNESSGLSIKNPEDLSSFERYAVDHWIVHVKEYESHLERQDLEPDTVLVKLLKSFVGSLSSSGPQYQRWHQLFTTETPGRDGPLEEILSEEQDLSSAISPSRTAIHLICRIGIYVLLRDWWDGEAIGVFTGTNDNGKSPILLSAAGGSVSICKALMRRDHSVNPDPSEVTQTITRGGMSSISNCSALSAAAWHGQLEVAQLLLENGAEVDFEFPTEESLFSELAVGSALAAAASRGHLEIVQLLLESGANVHRGLWAHGSALEAACGDGHTQVVQLLLDKGSDPNQLSFCSSIGSPLAAAAFWGQTNICSLLLNEGADPNLELQSFYRLGSALAAASRWGNYGAMQVILDAGGHADQRLSICNYGSALIAAACNQARKEQHLRLLLEHGADVNAVAFVGDYGTALIAAFAHKAEANYMYLVENGANVNLTSPFGPWGSAVIAAAYGESQDVRVFSAVKYLIDQGVDVKAGVPTGRYGHALISHACSWKWSSNVVELLVRHGADVNFLSTTGIYGSVLIAAVTEQDDPKVAVRHLLSFGADPNLMVATGYYGTALIAASLRGDLDVVKLLVDTGANVEVVSTVGDFGTPLISAAASGESTVVQFMLDHGARVNDVVAAGSFGSALSAASLFGWEDCVLILLHAGANVNVRMQRGPYHTALQAAQADLTLDFFQERGWWLAFITLDHQDHMDLHLESVREEVEEATQEYLGTWDEVATRKARVADLLRSHGAIDDDRTGPPCRLPLHIMH